MARSRSPFFFAYCPNNTIMHRMPAGFKLAGLCLISAVLPLVSPLLCGGYAVVLLCICRVARLSKNAVIRNTVFLAEYTAFLFILKVLGAYSLDAVYTALMETLLFMQRFALILYTAAVFYETTSKIALLVLCEKIETLFNPKGTTRLFSITLTVTVMCIPRIFETWQLLNHAYTARRGAARTLRDASERLTVLLPTLVEHLLAYAVTAEKAIRNRTAPPGGL